MVRVEYPAQEVRADVSEHANRERGFDGLAGTSENSAQAKFAEFFF